MKRLLFFAFWILLWCGSGCKSSKTGGTSGTGMFKKQVLVGVNIQSIEVMKYPLYGKDGEKWDPMAPFTTEPDLYIQMSQLGNMIYKSEVKEDVKQSSGIVFTSNLPFEIRAYTNEVLLELFDEDGISTDDNVGYLSFRPYDYEKKNSIELITSDQSTMIRLGVSWIYVDK